MKSCSKVITGEDINACLFPSLMNCEVVENTNVAPVDGNLSFQELFFPLSNERLHIIKRTGISPCMQSVTEPSFCQLCC